MKKGFIATSLIYSFFLVFCAVLLSYIGVSLHNKNLVDKANEDLRSDLKTKLVKNTNIGSYFKLDIKHPLLNVDDVKWIIFDYDDNLAQLVSDSVVISMKDYNNNLNDDINEINNLRANFYGGCIQGTPTILSYTDVYDTMKYTANTKGVVDVLTNADIDYLVVNGSTYYKFSYNLGNISSSATLAQYKNQIFKTTAPNLAIYPTNSDINVRLVINIPSGARIQGGSGTVLNSYTLSSVGC